MFKRERVLPRGERSVCLMSEDSRYVCVTPLCRGRFNTNEVNELKSPSPQSSPDISPASSFGASIANELNDSQNTTFSLPDEYTYLSSSQPQPQSSPLNPDQLRAVSPPSSHIHTHTSMKLTHPAPESTSNPPPPLPRLLQSPHKPNRRAHLAPRNPLLAILSPITTRCILHQYQCPLPLLLPTASHRSSRQAGGYE